MLAEQEARIIEVAKALGIGCAKTDDKQMKRKVEEIIPAVPPSKLQTTAKELPKANPPVAIRCYCCGRREQIVAFHDVHICVGCHNDLHDGEKTVFMIIIYVILTQYLFSQVISTEKRSENCFL